MFTSRAALPCLAAASLLCACAHAAGETNLAAARDGIDAFNRALGEAANKMDNAAMLALWEDDGVSLLPQTAPITGKKEIAKFLDGVMAGMPGAKMLELESQCFDVEIDGPWASEWCTEHQKVDLGPGKAPFEGFGKMLFVLHRGGDGTWRIKREMWNQGLAPSSVEPKS